MNKRLLQKPDGRTLRLYARGEIGPDSMAATNPPHAPIEHGSHLRWHPLRGEWIAYARHRQGRTFMPPAEFNPLAPTKSEANPTELPEGRYDVAVFENLFPSLASRLPPPPDVPPLYVETSPGAGACEVVVFTQDPESALSRLPVWHVDLLLQVLAERTAELGAREDVQYVMPFENRGVEMGVTLAHPHGQIYAYPSVPPIPARMAETQREHFARTGEGLLEWAIRNEEAEGARVLYAGPCAIAFLPAFARYPYETWVAPRRRVGALGDLTAGERADLARALATVARKYDGLWGKPFPYLLTLYQRPTDGEPHPEWHAHFEFFPPLRTREKLKFLAGTEIGAGMFVNDTWPEEKARELQAVPVDLESPPAQEESSHVRQPVSSV